MRSKAPLFSTLLAIVVLSAMVYFLILMFSKERIISPSSFERFVLIPSLLRDDNLTKIGTIRNYHYSASGKEKAFKSAVNLSTSLSKEKVDEHVRKYFLSNGFKESKEHKLWHKKQYISVSYQPAKEGQWDLKISIIESVGG